MRKRKRILTLGPSGRPALLSDKGQLEELATPTNALHGYAFLLLDCSGSMAGDKLNQAKRGAIDFAIHARDNNYMIGVIRFESFAEVICEPTSDIDALRRRIDTLTTGGMTAMHRALQLATQNIPQAGTRALIVVTDGMPDSPNDALCAAAAAKEMGVDIIALGTDDADRAFLRQLASREDLSVKVERKHLGRTLADAVKLLPDARD